MAKMKPKSNNEIKKFWSENPMTYYVSGSEKNLFKKVDAEIHRLHDYSKINKYILSRYIDHANYKNKKVLEIGPGLGTMAVPFVELGAKFTGLDLSKSHIKFCKKRFKNNKNATFIEGNAENLPFKDKTFDFVQSWGVLHHTPRTQKTITEIHRVLKEGGEGMIMLYHTNSIRYWIHKILKVGILQLGLLRYKTKQDFLNSCTDNHDKTKKGSPLAKSYTKKQIKNMFKKFRDVKINVNGEIQEVNAIPVSWFPVSKWLTPKKTRRKILEKYGWYLIINFKK